MEKAELKIDYTVYRESYPEGYEDLCRAALDVTKNAYCVYSGFAVGAAVLMNNGEVVCGTNQENVAYPSGLCAERTALFYVSGGGDQGNCHCSPGSWRGSGGQCYPVRGLSSGDGRDCSTL